LRHEWAAALAKSTKHKVSSNHTKRIAATDNKVLVIYTDKHTYITTVGHNPFVPARQPSNKLSVAME